eukprot:1192903-Rhodomonas_salina.4
MRAADACFDPQGHQAPRGSEPLQTSQTSEAPAPKLRRAGVHSVVPVVMLDVLQMRLCCKCNTCSNTSPALKTRHDDRP